MNEQSKTTKILYKQEAMLCYKSNFFIEKNKLSKNFLIFFYSNYIKPLYCYDLNQWFFNVEKWRPAMDYYKHFVDPQ